MATGAGDVVARGGPEAPETVELCVRNKDGFPCLGVNSPAGTGRADLLHAMQRERSRRDLRQTRRLTGSVSG